MAGTKQEKIREAIRHAAAEFMAEAADSTSLITVTNVHLTPKADRATILITVFPNDKEADALAFASRQGGKLRDFIGQRISLQHLPYISFALDVGEKNRQKIEELSSQSK